MNHFNFKRLSIILFSFLSALFVFELQHFSTNKTVSTFTIPSTNKVIVVDAGHGR